MQSCWWKEVRGSVLVLDRRQEGGVCTEEHLDRFFDNIRNNSAVDLLQNLAGFFIFLMIHSLCRLRSIALRDFISRSHPLRMIQGILDVSEPLFLGTFLKVDGYVSWRDVGRSLGLIRPRCAWWSFLLAMRCGVVGGECCEWLCGRVKNHCSQLMVWSSQSIWMDVMSWRNWNNLSIVPRIATGLWTIGRSGRTVIQCWCGVRTVVGSPTRLVGE